jgi:hypothetical protein
LKIGSKNYDAAGNAPSFGNLSALGTRTVCLDPGKSLDKSKKKLKGIVLEFDKCNSKRKFGQGSPNGVKER